MITMRDGDMPAPLTVNVVMTLMHRVTAGRLAFVVVTIVRSMKMTVVHIVDVITMRDGDMPAPFAMDMVVPDVLNVCSSHLRLAIVASG